MIDKLVEVHSHILPGIDDGSPDVDTSLKMIGMLKKQGASAIVLTPHYYSDSISYEDFVKRRDDSFELLKRFISTKKLEGRSDKALKYYKSTVEKMLMSVEKNVKAITTEDLREYLTVYQSRSTVSKQSVDNVRRNLSSFFTWLEDENYIVKSPARRIHKIRVSIQTNSLHGGMAFSIASSQDSFPVMGFCVYPRFSNNLSNKCPKSTQNTPVCNKTH